MIKFKRFDFNRNLITDIDTIHGRWLGIHVDSMQLNRPGRILLYSVNYLNLPFFQKQYV